MGKDCNYEVDLIGWIIVEGGIIARGGGVALAAGQSYEGVGHSGGGGACPPSGRTAPLR